MNGVIKRWLYGLFSLCSVMKYRPVTRLASHEIRIWQFKTIDALSLSTRVREMKLEATDFGRGLGVSLGKMLDAF